jgi:hypothetical protein
MNVTRRQWKREWTWEFDRLRTQLREEPQPAEDHRSLKTESSAADL